MNRGGDGDHPGQPLRRDTHGTAYLYNSQRFLSELYSIEGLK